MAASSPATTSAPLAGPAIHRGPAIVRLVSGSVSRRPLPASTTQTVSASAASTAPKPRVRTSVHALLLCVSLWCRRRDWMTSP